MLHTYNRAMTDNRTANLLGALALALTDRLIEETETRAKHGAAGPAALVSIGTAPGEPIDRLARTLVLSHSATVRLVDRLAADGLVARRSLSDGRAVGLHLTRSGATRRKAILEGRRQVLGEALAPLSAKQQDSLTALVETLLGRITSGRQSADHICRLCDEDACPQDSCPVECAVSSE